MHHHHWTFPGRGCQHHIRRSIRKNMESNILLTNNFNTTFASFMSTHQVWTPTQSPLLHQDVQLLVFPVPLSSLHAPKNTMKRVKMSFLGKKSRNSPFRHKLNNSSSVSSRFDLNCVLLYVAPLRPTTGEFYLDPISRTGIWIQHLLLTSNMAGALQKIFRGLVSRMTRVNRKPCSIQ